MKPRLIVSRQIPPDVGTRIRAEFDCPYPDGLDMDADTVIRMLTEHRADALMLTSHLKFPKAVIDRIPDHVRIAATCSVGTDHIDIPAARARGLPMTNTPDVLTECTADLAFMLLLNVFRRGAEYDQIMRRGWREHYGLGEMMGRRAWGKTLGLIGYGRIGQAMAARARGFGMKILYHSPRRAAPELEQGAAYFADFHQMLPHCDALSLHAPGGTVTAGIMNAHTFGLLPKGAVFVNASRGSLVDEEALLDALRSGHLYGAGLDVFHHEPDYDTRLAEMPNVFLCPHMGSATVETRNAMGFRALDNIAAVLAGRPPLDPIWR
jgi:hydroxypyruvate reductase